MWIFISLCLAVIPYVANGVTSGKLTGSRKTSILNDFNAARRAINSCTASGKNGLSSFPSPAKKIPDLIWSSALAQTAKEKAADCSGRHNSFAPAEGWTSSLKDKNGNKPGEIITSSTYSSATIDTLVYTQAPNQFIEAERNRYKWGKYGKANVYGNLNCWRNGKWLTEDASQGNCGHYTAIIWEQATHVGCGYATGCSGNKKVLVCHLQGYGNRLGATNYVGQFPYASGTYCSGMDSNDGILLNLGYEEDDTVGDSTQDNSSHTAVIAVVLLVVLFCVLGGAGFWFYRRRNSKVKHVEFNDDIGIDEDEDEENVTKETKTNLTDDDGEEMEVEVEIEVEMEVEMET